MSELNLRDFPKDEPLASSKYSTDAYEVSSNDQQLSFGDDVKLKLSAAGTFSAQVLNDQADKDADGIVPDVLPFNAGDVHLKIKASGKATASADFDVSSIAFALKATGDISLSDYRLHSGNEIGSVSLLKDLAPPRTIFRNGDVLDLKSGEALSMDAEGDFTASLSFSWSDVITSGASQLAVLAGVPLTVAFKVTPSLSVSVPVELSDSLVVTASRNAAGRIRIAVKKGTARSIGLSVKAGAIAGIANLDDLSKAVDAVLDALIAASLPKVEAALAKGAAALSPAEQKLLADAMQRLGVATPADLKTKIDGLKKKVEDKLKAIAQEKAEIAFTYEYKRTSARSALVDVIVQDDQFVDSIRKQAVGGNIEPLVSMLRDPASAAKITLVNFLDEQSIVKTSSFGFAFSFGKWFSTSESTKTELDKTDRRNLAGNVMRAYKGLRAFKQTLPDHFQTMTDFTWSVDLKADMSEYRTLPLHTGDFTFGLHYLIPHVTTIDDDSIPYFADFASMLRIGTSAAEVAAKLAELKGKATVTLQLLFKHDALRSITGRVAENDFGAWGEAFGAAMSYIKERPLMHDFNTRRDAFAQLWATDFASGGLDGDQLRNAVSQALGGSLLESAEDANAFGSFTNAVSVQYKEVVQARNQFESALLVLQNAFGQPATDDSAIVSVFDGLKAFWTQRPYTIASAVYLLTKAAEANKLDEVQRSMAVEQSDGTVTTIG